MFRHNVIILVKADEPVTENNIETWGSLTELCDVHGFSYNYLKKKKFPFEYKGLKFIKTRYKKQVIKS